MTPRLIDGHEHLVALFIVNSLPQHRSAVRFPGVLGSPDDKNICSRNIVPFCWQLHENDFWMSWRGANHTYSYTAVHGPYSALAARGGFKRRA